MMKTFLTGFVLYWLCFTSTSKATECYQCRPSEDNLCDGDFSKMATGDTKTDLGCYTLEFTELVKDKNLTMYGRSSFEPTYGSIDCDAIMERIRQENVKCTSCNSDLCNSSPINQITFLTIVTTLFVIWYYHK